jgi:transposase
MYCDPILWKNVRDCVLENGKSRREAALKFRMSRNTVGKMLRNEMPPRGIKRSCRRPMIGPHEATIRKMMEERSRSGYSFSPRIREIFEHISKEEDYCGSYSAVRD